jgi:hypothetical protein
LKLSLIIGPGRSGTSSLAEQLSVAGVDFGHNTRPGDRFNPSGYFENPLISGINQAILLESCSFNGDFLAHTRTFRPLLRAEVDAVSAELDAQYSGDHIGIKCPRFCLTLNVWEDYLKNTFDDISLYICLRHPLLVSDSLVRTGRSKNHAILWWASHIISAFKQLPSWPKATSLLQEHAESPADPIGEAAVALWLEIAQTNQISAETSRSFIAIFERLADWLPVQASVERSMAAILAVGGNTSDLRNSIEEAFPALSEAWSIRGDYVTRDDPLIWKDYERKVRR